jgi:hypothetical protein
MVIGANKMPAKILTKTPDQLQITLPRKRCLRFMGDCAGAEGIWY